MDIDSFVAQRAPQWDRLDRLARRRRLSVAEADELLALHQATATDLSAVRTELPDTELVGRLSGTLALSRAALSGGGSTGRAAFAAFFTAKLPAALYRSRWWWGSVALATLVVAFGLGWWLDTHVDAMNQLVPPDYARALTEPGGEFRTYYSSSPARDFAAGVWTHNFFLALETLFSGALLGIPVVFMLWENAENLAIDGALMVHAGQGNEFFILITPHGLLELTSLFVAAGTGLRIGWTMIDPGPRTRLAALQHEGRIAAVVGLGVIMTLLCSGLIEAFVTPSSLPGVARIGIGVLVEVAFLCYVFILGRAAYRRGEGGDLSAADRAAEEPSVG